MILLFELLCTAMILFDYIVHRRIITTISVISVPYMFILPVNNLFAVKYGFYPINNEVILMLMLGLFCIFTGSFIADLIFSSGKSYGVKDSEDCVKKLDHFRMRSMRNFAIIIEGFCMLRLLMFIASYGFSALSDDETENLVSGIFGHLYLLVYVLLPFMLLYWLKHKKEILYLFVFVFGVGFGFLSFTKYHSIGLIIMTYIFVSIEDKKYIKKGAFCIVAAAVLLFVSNYIIGFLFKGNLANINKDFYILHLWKYIGGSVVHDNNLFTSGLNVGVGFIQKILYCIMPLPNMFLKPLFGYEYVPPLDFPMEAVASNSEESNVIDFIGYMFPSKGDVFDIVVFAVIMICIGIIFSAVYNCSLKKKQSFAITLCTFMAFFEFLFFFGIFASKSMTWELLVISIILPRIFDRRTNLRIGKYYFGGRYDTYETSA
ncbi:MAG: DUF6337 family protein [Clostridia bacterium]|nr:DUF6337 family protein [Clostridia bacterium]